ncbi:MAG: dockerin type I repeat-containing protein [Spirochaetales bacterium]|nr:dockerin type I repeat-containing protein [Spirochaetales bacterium]
MKKVSLILLFSVTALSLSAQSMGDVNNDGSLNIVDALLIAREYVGLSNPVFYPEAADVNQDGVINIIDALLVAQYYVNPISIPTPFPTINPEAELPEQLEQARLLWWSSGMRNYEMLYRYKSSSFIYSKESFQMTVKTPPGEKFGTETKNILRLESTMPIDPLYINSFYSIKELFALLTGWIENGYNITRLEWDPLHGCPTEIAVDPDKGVIDDEFAISLTLRGTMEKIMIQDQFLRDTPLDTVFLWDARLVGHDLVLEVGYGGGCVNRGFTLQIGADLLESYPVQFALYLEWDTQSDVCPNEMDYNVAFNLIPLANYYYRHYGAYDKMRLNVYKNTSSRTPQFSLLYEPQKLITE